MGNERAHQDRTTDLMIYNAPHQQFAKTVGATNARRTPQHPTSYSYPPVRIKIYLYTWSLARKQKLLITQEYLKDAYSCYYNLCWRTLVIKIDSDWLCNQHLMIFSVFDLTLSPGFPNHFRMCHDAGNDLLFRYDSNWPKWEHSCWNINKWIEPQNRGVSSATDDFQRTSFCVSSIIT